MTDDMVRTILPRTGIGTCRQGGPASGSHLSSPALGRPGPRKQVVELFHGPAIYELGQDIGKVDLRVYGMELAGFDQGCQAGPVGGALIVTCEQTILSVQDNWADSSLNIIRVDLDTAILEKAQEAHPVIEAIADCLGDRAFLRDRDQLGFQPGFQVSTIGLDCSWRTARRSSAVRPRIRSSTA